MPTTCGKNPFMTTSQNALSLYSPRAVHFMSISMKTTQTNFMFR